ncbi:MAG: hypothetical protein NW226_01375 [Microscillaceae bacterium]|nr:hypothetical protein [Microscillaceae bacterium]
MPQLHKGWIFAFLLVFGILQQYGTFCSIGLTYDSLDYLHAAQDFAQGESMHNKNGSPYIERVPLFPILLSFLGDSKTLLASWINLLSLLLSLGIFFWLANEHIQSATIRVFFGLSLSFSTPLFLVGNFLWSEALFLAFLSLHFHFYALYLRSEKFLYILGMAGVAFLFCLQRNPGIFFVAGMVLVLLIQDDFIRSLKLSAVYLVIALSGWFWWSYHCYTIGGTDYHPTLRVLFQDVPGNLILHLTALTNWFMPTFFSFTLKILIFSGIALVLWLVWENFKENLVNYQAQFIRGIFFVSLFYLLCMVILERTVLEEVERYEALNYPALMLVAFVGMDLLWRNLGIKSSLRTVLLIGLVLWSLYPVVRSLNNVQLWHNNQCRQVLGIGY